MIPGLLPFLSEIYGPGADTQVSRYARAAEQFQALYGPGPLAFYRVPGRVNLIGEHTDYQQGYVLPVALDKDFVFVTRRRDDAMVRIQNTEKAFASRGFAISEHIRSDRRGDWGNFARGAAQMLQKVAGAPLFGADILVSGRAPLGIPRGAGLSSSSALTVGIALTLASLNELAFSSAELAWLCGEAEWYVGTRGGIMDQFIVLLGQRDHALFLDCRATSPADAKIPTFRTAQVPLPDGYQIIVADSRVRHQNVRSDFNVRVLEGRIGVALLKRAYPSITHLRDLEGLDWAEIEPLLPESMSWGDLDTAGLCATDLIDVELPAEASPFLVRRRCRHVVSENARVRQSVQALQQGDVEGFSDLLNQAHTSVSQDYGASCDELDILVRLSRQVNGVMAARMTGAGWGGCVIALARQGCERDFVSHVRPHYHDETGLWPNIFVCQAGQGAGLVCAS